MSFVDYQREALAWQFANLARNDRIFLKCADDDRLASLKRILQLCSALVDVLDQAERLLELPNCRLQLSIQHFAIRHDDDGIEYALVVRVVQGRKLVCQPRDRVALTAAGGMLNQVMLTGPVPSRVRDQTPHTIELMIARKD